MNGNANGNGNGTREMLITEKEALIKEAVVDKFRNTNGNGSAHVVRAGPFLFKAHRLVYHSALAYCRVLGGGGFL